MFELRKIWVISALVWVSVFAGEYNLKDYFPVHESWKRPYLTNGSSIDTARLDQVMTIPERPLPQATFNLYFSDTEVEHFTFDSSGLYMIGQDNSHGKFWFLNPVGIASPVINIGDKIISDWKVTKRGSGSIENWGKVTVTVQRHLDTLQTAKNTFKDILSIKVELYGKEPILYYLAKNIGIVKAVSPSTFGTRVLILDDVAAINPHTVSKPKSSVYPGSVIADRRSSVVTFRFLNANNHARVRVISPTGKTVLRESGISSNAFSWDTRGFSNGHYVIRIDAGSIRYERHVTVFR